MTFSLDKEKLSKPTRKKPSLKVVLRRLPFAMCEEELIEQLDPFPSTIRQRWFCQADSELLPFAFSRAYFVFEDEAEAIAFCERFNGYVFVDKQGNESVAIAEQAPCSVIPNRDSKKMDKRMNTLESESEYLKFLEMYNNSTVKKVTDFDGLLKELEEKRKITNFVKSTPLTEFVEKQLFNKNRRTVPPAVGQFSGGGGGSGASGGGVRPIQKGFRPPIFRTGRAEGREIVAHSDRGEPSQRSTRNNRGSGRLRNGDSVTARSDANVASPDDTDNQQQQEDGRNHRQRGGRGRGAGDPSVKERPFVSKNGRPRSGDSVTARNDANVAVPAGTDQQQQHEDGGNHRQRGGRGRGGGDPSAKARPFVGKSGRPRSGDNITARNDGDVTGPADTDHLQQQEDRGHHRQRGGRGRNNGDPSVKERPFVSKSGRPRDDDKVTVRNDANVASPADADHQQQQDDGGHHRQRGGRGRGDTSAKARPCVSKIGIDAIKKQIDVQTTEKSAEKSGRIFRKAGPRKPENIA